MKIIGKLTGVLLITCSLAGCGDTKKPTLEEKISQQKDSTDLKFPPAVPLSQLKATEMLPTLENRLPEGKNAIYAPAFLYAWNEIQQLLQSPVVSGPENSIDFKLINESRSYQHALAEGDFVTEAYESDEGFVARAYFRKFVPFGYKFDRLVEAMEFGTTKVEAFGLIQFDPEKVQQIQIMYYKDDDHFVLKLIPKDKTQEIILSKGIALQGTFAELITATEKLITEGLAEAETNINPWKYIFAREDDLAIPIIRFNLESNYPQLEGQQFKCRNGSPHVLVEAFQRIAFSFDESGAAVESYAMALADSAGAAPVKVEPPQPQHFFFDKPFLIYMKPLTGSQPYFVMKVENKELMNKQK